MRVAFVTTRIDKASFRFRISEYFPYLNNDIQYECITIPRGFIPRRFFFQRLRSFDIVLWQKRLLGRTDLRSLRKNSRHLIYDLDDAVMYNDSPSGDFESIRLRGRFRRMVESADQIIVGNEYLRGLVRRHTPSEKITHIPSTVDIEKWRSNRINPGTEELVIGWVGSQSTLIYWMQKLDLWKIINRRHPGIRFKVVCDQAAKILAQAACEGFNLEVTEWSEQSQVADCDSFDIGIMPLPDNPWTRGKCGFKLLQYLSLSKSAVASPVGVNTDIIKPGCTGLLADSDQQWQDVLHQLIESRVLRARLGEAGRKHIEINYSIQAWTPAFAKLFQR